MCVCVCLCVLNWVFLLIGFQTFSHVATGTVTLKVICLFVGEEILNSDIRQAVADKIKNSLRSVNVEIQIHVYPKYREIHHNIGDPFSYVES